jgi:NADH:ubiquinone oxidoreductase subunit F (NADH-binding)
MKLHPALDAIRFRPMECAMDETTRAANTESYPHALPEGTVIAGYRVGITHRRHNRITGHTAAIKEFFPAALYERAAAALVGQRYLAKVGLVAKACAGRKRAGLLLARMRSLHPRRAPA